LAESARSDQRYQFVDHISQLSQARPQVRGELHRDSLVVALWRHPGDSNSWRHGLQRQRIESSPIEDFFAGLRLNGSLLIGDPTRHIHIGRSSFVQTIAHHQPSER